MAFCCFCSSEVLIIIITHQIVIWITLRGNYLQIDFPKLTLVLGGANSGKSLIAEKLTAMADLPKTYIATAQAYDDEMRAKIEAHLIQRGTGWQTVEAPLDITQALSNGITLIDCLTMWISNHMMTDTDPNIDDLVSKLNTHQSPVICVSNEAGMGVVPDNAMARKFRTIQGNVNQQIAAHADLVILVVAGIPMAIKGQLPKGLA